MVILLFIPEMKVRLFNPGFGAKTRDLRFQGLLEKILSVICPGGHKMDRMLSILFRLSTCTIPLIVLKAGTWNIAERISITIATGVAPVTTMIENNQKIWCGTTSLIKILDSNTLKVCN